MFGFSYAAKWGKQGWAERGEETGQRDTQLIRGRRRRRNRSFILNLNCTQMEREDKNGRSQGDGERRAGRGGRIIGGRSTE